MFGREETLQPLVRSRPARKKKPQVNELAELISHFRKNKSERVALYLWARFQPLVGNATTRVSNYFGFDSDRRYIDDLRQEAFILLYEWLSYGAKLDFQRGQMLAHLKLWMFGGLQNLTYKLIGQELQEDLVSVGWDESSSVGIDTFPASQLLIGPTDIELHSDEARLRACLLKICDKIYPDPLAHNVAVIIVDQIIIGEIPVDQVAIMKKYQIAAQTLNRIEFQLIHHLQNMLFAIGNGHPNSSSNGNGRH